MFIVNIGLVASCDYECGDLSTHQVESVVSLFGFHLAQSEVAQSRSEPTLVGLLVDDVLDGTSRARLYKLSAALHQDCIAVIEAFKPTSATAATLALRNGRLIGPNARRWGDFDAAQFILPTFAWEVSNG